MTGLDPVVADDQLIEHLANGGDPDPADPLAATLAAGRDEMRRTVNVELLRDVLTHITEHPEQHDQTAWATRTECGTAYCVAGHAVVRSGYKVDWAAGFGEPVTTVDVVGSDLLISELAAQLLGIELDEDDNEGHHLFDGDNTLDDLWRIAGELADGAITRPSAATPTK